MPKNYFESEIYILKSKKGGNYYIGGTVMAYHRLPVIFRATYNRYKQGLSIYRNCYQVVKYDDFTIELLEAYNCESRSQLNERVVEWNEKYKKQL